MWPIEIANSAIEPQAAQKHGDGSEVCPCFLWVVITDSVAGAVDDLRPGVGGGQLKPVRKPSVQPCLEGVIGGIALTVVSLGMAICRITPRSR